MLCPACDFTSESLRGVARHYRATHGATLSHAQRAEIISAQSEESGTASTGFSSLADAASAAPTSDAEAAPEAKVRRPRGAHKPTEAEIKMEAMRKTIGEACSSLTGVMLSSWLGFTFTPEDREKMREGWLSFFQSAAITLNFEGLNYEVKSAWVLLLFPITSIIMVLASHLGEISESLKKRKEKK